ncbi:MAG: DUF2804 family protein [Spirochaetales bacterium]
MYTRPITKPPKHIVKNGRAVFGDFNFPPVRFDIQHLKQPFSLMPLPNFLTKLRIRSNLCFSFVAENYVGTIEILDARFFAFGEVNIWERSENRKFSYRTVILGRRVIPTTLILGSCKSHKKRRSLRIKWDYTKKTFTVLCKFTHDNMRPDLYISFSADTGDDLSGNLTSVVPAPIIRRCCATHHLAVPINGVLCTATPMSREHFEQSAGLGFFTIRRSFYNLRVYCHSITAQGFVNGQRVQFNLYTSNNDAFDPDMHNENVLFTGTEATPLPPVTVTHPKGVTNQWIIQDTESMIDLSFFPISDTVRKKSIALLRTEYHTLYGICEGTVLNKKGEVFPLKEFSAIAKKQYLRL